MNDLKGGIGFASACSHGEQDTLLPFRNRLHCAVNGDLLVVTRTAARAVKEIILGADPFGFWCGDAFVALIAVPQFGWARKILQLELSLYAATGSGAVMFVEPVAVAAEHYGYIQNSGVVQPLLNTSHD